MCTGRPSWRGRPRGLIGIAGLAAVLALVGLAPPPAAEARLKRGIDVSRFQGVINWQRVGETRHRFAIVQASRGDGGDCAVVPEQCGPDPFWRRNYRLARAVGLRVGPYHRAFADGSTDREAKRDARREARLFSETVGELRRRDLIPVIDVETPFGSLDAERLVLWVETWMKVVERRVGAPSMIYTNYSSWQATGDSTAFAERGVPLWVANFGVASPLVPAADWAGAGWSIWQYTSSGRIRGIRGPVDKNRAAVPLRRLSVGRNPVADPNEPVENEPVETPTPAP